MELVVDSCSPIGILRQRMTDERLGLTDESDNKFDFPITAHYIEGKVRDILILVLTKKSTCKCFAMSTRFSQSDT